MVEVQFPTRWHSYTGGAESFSSSAATVGELLIELVSAHPELRAQIYTGGAAASLSARLVVNNSLVMDGGDAVDTALRSGDRVSFVLPIAGG